MFDIFKMNILNEAEEDDIDAMFNDIDQDTGSQNTQQQSDGSSINTNNNDTSSSETQNDNKYSIDDQLNDNENNQQSEENTDNAQTEDSNNDDNETSDDTQQEDAESDENSEDQQQDDNTQEPEQTQEVPKLTILNLDSLNTKNNNIRIMTQFNELITKIDECLEVIDNMTIKTNYQSEVVNFVSNNLLDLKKDLNACVLYKFDSSYEENVTKYVVYIKRFRLAMDIVRKVLDTNIKDRSADL